MGRRPGAVINRVASPRNVWVWQKEVQKQRRGRDNRDSPALAMVASARSPTQHPHSPSSTAAAVQGFLTVTSPGIPSEIKGRGRRFIRRGESG